MFILPFITFTEFLLPLSHKSFAKRKAGEPRALIITSELCKNRKVCE